MSSEIRDALARVAAENEINCTGLGEVGCRGRKGWHSWHEHRTHVAQSQADALADLLAARDRRVRGEAWDEGHGSLCRRHGVAPFAACVNPYRADRIEADA